MTSTKKSPAKIVNIKNRILWAIWRLTETDDGKYVSKNEIADRIESEFGTRVTGGYVLKEIKRINTRYETFASLDQHVDSLDGRPGRVWRLHKTTISFPATAFVVQELLHSGSPRDRSAATALRNTKQLAKKSLGLSPQQVKGRVDAALRSGYIECKKEENYVKPCYTGTPRYYSEEFFIAKLAALAPKYAATALPESRPRKGARKHHAN